MAGQNCLVCTCFILFSLTANVWCVPMSQFYPFGVMEGDLQLPTPPSSNSPMAVNARIDLSVPVLFYGQRTNIIYVRMFIARHMLGS